MWRGAILVFASLALAPVPARADGEIAGRMRLMARSLQADYGVKRARTVTGAAAEVPLAIFDFACNEALARQRVGSAVAELLKQQFVGAAPFRLVERAELERILTEQAIQQTGATDQNTGVQLGKLVGAKVCLTGSVDKLGPSYQVSARLVDVETADVIAVAVQELPARAFEAEAGRLLNLVPDEQALAVYVGGGFSPPRPGLAGQTITVISPATGSPMSLSMATRAISLVLGGGIRYLIQSWLLADLSIWPFAGQTHIKPDIPGSGASTQLSAGEVKIDGTAIAFSLNWTTRVVGRWRGFAGVGVELMLLSAAGSGNGAQSDSAQILADASGGTSTPLATLSFDQSPAKGIEPLVQAGVEWRPRARLGWGLTATFYPLPPRVPLHLEMGGTKRDFGHLDLPLFALGTSVAVYF